MRLQEIVNIESTNIASWEEQTDEMIWGFCDVLDYPEYLKAHVTMALTPIALETLSGGTLLLNLKDLIINAIIGPIMVAVAIPLIPMKFLYALLSGELQEALEMILLLLQIILMPLFIASYFAITAASFVTRPLATLYYLSLALGNFCFGTDEMSNPRCSA